MTPFQEGYNAFNCGYSVQANPYSSKDRLGRDLDWLAGWKAARNHKEQPA